MSIIRKHGFYPAPVLIACFALLLSSCIAVDDFNPCSGAVGSELTVIGYGFSLIAGDNIVSIGGTRVPASDISSVSKNELRAKVPEGSTSGRIEVSNSSGSAMSRNDFQVTEGLAEWTFMVYLDADNDLEPSGEADFAEMADIGSCGNVNVVVQYDGLNGDCPQTKRFLVSRNSSLLGPAEAYLDEQNMGDPAVLADFIAWAVERYPARRYALVIWNHGGGWKALDAHSPGIEPSSATAGKVAVSKSIAQDVTNGDELYMHEVREALERARERTSRTVDLLGFDACYMGMIEVAYSMRGLCSIMVGSEDSEPAFGWDYDVLLSGLAHSPGMAADQLAKLIVDSYNRTQRRDLTQSAYDMSKIEAAAAAVDRFAGAASSDWKVLRDARIGARVFHPSSAAKFWGTDLKGFASRVFEKSSVPAIKDAAAGVLSSLDALIIAESHSANMEGSNGAAIYFPPDKAAYERDPEHANYLDSNVEHPVDFARDYRWDEWLLSYYANTADLPAP
jgi:hypothetical protein